MAGEEVVVVRRRVVALDLEGTLVSNAVSVFPRPHLDVFLGELDVLADEVVLFTSVSTVRARAVLELLAGEGVVPGWFASVRILGGAPVKDLSRVADLSSAVVVLVDDQAGVVVAGQEARWVPVVAFDAPYSADDRGLVGVAAQVRDRFDSLAS